MMAFDANMLLEVAQAAGVPEEDVAQVAAAALEAAYATRPDAISGVRAIAQPGVAGIELRDPDGNPVDPGAIGARGATAARQTVVAWLRDLERVRKVGPWAERENTAILAIVRKALPNGDVRLDAGGVTAIMPAGEATPGEELRPGQQVPVLLLAANVSDREAIRLTVSRRQPHLVADLFRAHADRAGNSTRIVTVAREPGTRSKVAYTGPSASALHDLVGPAGINARSVAASLNGERFDLVEYQVDLASYVAAALSPARVVAAEVIDAAKKRVRVTVEPDQMATARGADGINLRLATRLTGARIELLATR